MTFCAKTEYACKALLELCLHYPNSEPLQIHAISERQKIPEKFLTQILINLKQLGLVQSLRGKNGGYLLSKKPSAIFLGDVVSRLENHDLEPDQPNGNTNAMEQVFSEVERCLWDNMNKISFEEIANRQRSISQTMMFDI